MTNRSRLTQLEKARRKASSKKPQARRVMSFSTYDGVIYWLDERYNPPAGGNTLNMSPHMVDYRRGIAGAMGEYDPADGYKPYTRAEFEALEMDPSIEISLTRFVDATGGKLAVNPAFE